MRTAFRTFTSFVLAYALAFAGLPAFGQSARILDANYVTKFGRMRNFVVNPDAQIGVAGVTASGSAPTQSTTTPVSENGATEFNVTLAANGTLDFLTSGATQAMLGGQMCEVGFRGRGFQSTTSLQAYDGTNVLATYAFGTLTNTQEVSLPFPCPLNPSTIRVRLTDTATLSGTNEIAGVYFGKQRNAGDAANITAWQSDTLTASNTRGASWTVAGSTTAPTFGTNSGTHLWYRRIGDTMSVLIQFKQTTAGSAGSGAYKFCLPSQYSIDTSKTRVNTVNDFTAEKVGEATISNGTTIFTGKVQPNDSGCVGLRSLQTTGTTLNGPTDFTTTSSLTFASTTLDIYAKFELPIANWPIASSAVTPSQQNVYGARKWDGNQTSTSRNTNAYLGFSGATYASNVTNIGSATACTSTSDLCLKIPSMPAGDYSVSVTASLEAGPSTSCAYGIGASNDGSNIITSVESTSSLASENSYVSSFSGTYSNVTTADREFYVLGNRISGANSCAAIGASSSRRITIEVKPLSRAQIQPVFVQSPVKAAGTGVAPLTGEMNNVITGTLTVQTATRSTAGQTVTTIGTIAIPSAGCYEFVLQDNVYRNAYGAASSSGFGGFRILNSTDSLIVTEDPYAAFFSNTASDIEAMFAASVHLSAVRCYTSAKTITAQLYATYNGGSGITSQNRATGVFYAKNVGDR